MADSLKLGKSDPADLPGLALPEAFISLDNRLETTLHLCHLNGVVEGPLLGLVTVCQELQNLLKFAFIENGLLASRIEILTRYQMESTKKTDKKVNQTELSHKTTKKQVKKLRKRLSVYEILQRKKSQQWWDVKVKSTDYDTFSSLARGAGCPDLEFMLRVNQILIDFVNDCDRQELVLPPMGSDERAELSKLSSIYKLRCRYGKSTQLASSTLIKARQTTIPNPGEVDAVLDSFARSHKHLNVEEVSEATQDGSAKDTNSQTAASSKPKPSSPPTGLLPSMLTPLSSLSPPTIDIGSSSLSLGPSPPTSGLNTPTAESAQKRMGFTHKESSTNEQKKSGDGGPQETPPNQHHARVESQKSLQLKDPRLHPPSNSPSSSSAQQGSSALQQQLQYTQLQQQGRTLNLTRAQVASGGLAGKSALSSGGLLFQGHLQNLGLPAVAASPMKLKQMIGGEVKKVGEGDGGKREKDVGTTSQKRIRLTRKSAGGNTPED